MTTRPVPWRQCVRNIIWLSFGMGLPLAVTCLLLWNGQGPSGVLVLDYSLRAGLWRFAVAAGRPGPIGEFFESGCDRWFYLTGTLGLLALFWRKVGPNACSFSRPSSFCSFFATAAGLYFRGHYFILMLPVLCLLIGDFFVWLVDALGRTRWPWLRGATATLFFAACAGF
jgi:hypothetical protein